MKRIRLSKHAVEQAVERGATEAEIRKTIEQGVREPAKHGRFLYRHNFQFRDVWNGQHYAIKQVAPVVAERQNEIVVVTVYTFYF